MGQLTLIFAVCLLGEGMATVIAFPSSVISMVLLAIFLMIKWVKEEQIQESADFLMANMGIFYIPPCIGMMDYFDLILAEFIPFFLVAGLTTPVVYAVTGFTVQLMMKKRNTKKEEGLHDS